MSTLLINRAPTIGIAAVLLSAAFLVAFGQLPAEPGAINIVGIPLSAAEALEAVNSTFNQTGGEWEPVEVIGLSWGQSYGLSQAQLSVLYSGCNLSTGPTGPITLPARPQQFTAGYLPDWLVVELSPDNEVLTTVVTYSGHLSVNLASIQMGTCASSFRSFGLLPARFLDSPQVAISFGDRGGTAFSSAYPGSYERFVFASSAWGVAYTTCSPLNPTATGFQILAGFQSGTGSQIGQTLNETIPCSQYSPFPVVEGA